MIYNFENVTPTFLHSEKDRVVSILFCEGSRGSPQNKFYSSFYLKIYRFSIKNLSSRFFVYTINPINSTNLVTTNSWIIHFSKRNYDVFFENF